MSDYIYIVGSSNAPESSDITVVTMSFPNDYDPATEVFVAESYQVEVEAGNSIVAMFSNGQSNVAILSDHYHFQIESVGIVFNADLWRSPVLDIFNSFCTIHGYGVGGYRLTLRGRLVKSENFLALNEFGRGIFAN